MLSVQSGHSVEYLTDAVGSGGESYYLDAVTSGEPPGQWNGAQAAAFGLRGEVDAAEMAALYGSFADPRDPAFHDPSTRDQAARLGLAPRRVRTPDEVVAARLEKHPGALPEEIQAWRVQAEREPNSTVHYTDLTFGVPKSVTVLHTAFRKAELEAQRAGDESAARQWAGRRVKVEQAIHAGNGAMLDFMAANAGFVRSSREQSGRAVHYLPAAKWTVASFLQHTNRDLEPHLHIHNAVHSRVVLDDGRVLSLDGTVLRAWKQAGGSLGERVMQETLTRTLGVQWRLNEAGHTRDVVGVDQAAITMFSGRTAKITKRTAELLDAFEARVGRGPTPLEYNSLRQEATLKTRRGKTHQGETTEQLLDRWHGQLRRELAGGLQRVAGRFQHARPAAVQERVEFSPGAVVAQALDAVQRNRATWTKPELMRQIDLALPDNLGGIQPDDVVRLIAGLADEAVASQEVIQTAGQAVAEVPAELRREDGSSVYASPCEQRFATRQHVIAEESLRRAAVDRGHHSVPGRKVDAWLAERPGMLEEDQAAAVRGLATSDAGLAVLLGPAGAGKSHAAGALAAVWGDLAGGRVVGLAVTQVATEVLREDGIADASNVTAWLDVQKKLAAGEGTALLGGWQLTERDIVLVDEGSMVDTEQLAQIREHTGAAGARIVVAGDPAQLGAVGAGGMMALLSSGEAQTFSLADVRRFRDPWERAASLRLRSGDTAVLTEYQRHGRIRDAGLPAEAAQHAGTAYVADRLAGKTSVIVTSSNEAAAELSAGVRATLAGLGLVEHEGVPLRDGTTAGVGDVIAARKINWQKGVLNRRQYEVLDRGDDGSLTVASVTSGTVHQLDPAYVRDHVTLGYSGTAHSCQGQTVDTAHLVVDPRLSREAVYVGLTRGRLSNTAWVSTREGERDPLAPKIGVTAPEARTAAAVLAGVLERNTQELSATAEARAHEEWASSAATLDARIEDAARVACRARLDQHLDDLVAEGVMPIGARARLGADDGTEFLSRVVRAAEQAGHDPREVLRGVVAARDLAGVRSVAQILSARVRTSTSLAPAGASPIPGGLSPAMTAYMAGLHEKLEERRAVLGAEAVAAPPRWAVEAFGQPPAEADALAVWEARVAVVAALREASGWDSPDAAVGPAPGVMATERRAAWHQAWEALGRPTAQAEEGDLSEGALRNRVAAWRRAQEWAPTFVDEHLESASTAAADGAREATLAGAEGREADAEKLGREAEAAALAARALDDAARERGRWVLATAATRETAVRAQAELEQRGVVIGDEPDRISVDEYVLEVVADELGPVVVQRRLDWEAPAVVEPAGLVATPAEAEVIAARAAVAGERLNDQHSLDDAHLADDGWAAVDEESAAWESAAGDEEALLHVQEVEVVERWR
jgi:AAA domain/TrwC relaxase